MTVPRLKWSVEVSNSLLDLEALQNPFSSFQWNENELVLATQRTRTNSTSREDVFPPRYTEMLDSAGDLGNLLDFSIPCRRAVAGRESDLSTREAGIKAIDAVCSGVPL